MTLSVFGLSVLGQVGVTTLFLVPGLLAILILAMLMTWVFPRASKAEVDLKLTEYRKPDPGPIEEFVFFDHPSTRHRVHDAMQWREAMGTP